MIAEILKFLCIPFFGILGCFALERFGISHAGFAQAAGMGTGIGSAMAYMGFVTMAFIDDKLGGK